MVSGGWWGWWGWYLYSSGRAAIVAGAQDVGKRRQPHSAGKNKVTVRRLREDEVVERRVGKQMPATFTMSRVPVRRSGRLAENRQFRQIIVVMHNMMQICMTFTTNIFKMNKR